jgi:DnaJ-class molecular chaperone
VNQRQRREAKDLSRFIDAHGGRLGPFRSYQVKPRCPRCDVTGTIRQQDLPAGGQQLGETCARCGGTGRDGHS